MRRWVDLQQKRTAWGILGRIMKYSQNLRRLMRKAAVWVGSGGSLMALRGCPCPPAMNVPSQNYTKSVPVDGATLDGQVSSWDTFCAQSCAVAGVKCFIQIQTSPGNSEPVMVRCGELNSGYGATSATMLSVDPWMGICKDACGEEQDCRIGVDVETSKPVIDCESWFANCAGGRRTEGIGGEEMGDETGLVGEALGFSKMAALEAQSVPAFGRMARELRAHGAPRHLQRKARRSRRDELRHVRMMGALAERFGGKRARVPGERLWVRTLFEMALENAVEGCIRETYGAYLADIQARTSRDAEVRGILRRIAKEETEHAELSWEVHRWAMARLSAAEREIVHRGMAAAMSGLNWPKQ